ncbi:hypothetical protein G9P44_002838 [Scheffersomyces stipitis]|nr:hypothetical protein G9P44_002838 [Scheffersomyces stipitis]
MEKEGRAKVSSVSTGNCCGAGSRPPQRSEKLDRSSYNPPMACYTTTKARPFSVNVNLSPLATILPDSMKKISGKENSPAQSDNQ